MENSQDSNLASQGLGASNKPEIAESSFVLNERSQPNHLDHPVPLESDLSHHIPGLYRLLDLCKDDGSNVDKIIISKESLKKFCNKMVPSSFKSISDINYKTLNSVSVNLIGCYGNNALITKLLFNEHVIDKRIYSLLVDSQLESSVKNKDRPSLRPGIYLLMMPPDLGLVIHWSEPGCYEENVSSQRKKNMTNLHRYLTKLTDHQLCLMSESDLERFIWNSENKNEKDNNEEKEGANIEFEVKRSQEKDFRISPGFQIHLPQQIISDIRDGFPLKPIVVESVTSQILVTQKKIIATSKMNQGCFQSDHNKFKENFNKKLNGHALRISKSMNMKNLEILIKICLSEMEDELLGPYRKSLEDAKSQIDLKKTQERNSIKEDAEIFTKYAWKRLRQEYTEFESLLNQEPTGNFTMQQVGDVLDDISQTDIDRIKSKYTGKYVQIKNALKINSRAWMNLRKRYAFITIIIEDALGEADQGGHTQDIMKSMCRAIFDMFMDEERDYYKLSNKYFGDKKGYTFFKLIKNFSRPDHSRVTNAASHANSFIKGMSDKEFIREICSMEFESLFQERQEIVNVFLKEYEKWKKDTFPVNIHNIVPKHTDQLYMKTFNDKLDEEYSSSKKQIEEDEFNRICNEIENRFPTGPILRIMNLYDTNGYSKGYYVAYEDETTQPDQLKITIYQTSIDEGDNLSFSEDEFHVPTLKFNRQHGRIVGISFQINLETHEIRNISQFENNFFFALWNNKENRLEIYFDPASRLPLSIQSNPPKIFKILYPGKNSLISVNEPKGLIGLYDINSGVLNVYAFDEKYVNLLPRATNVQLAPWYSHMVPEIQQFFFIKDTEDVCFIEKNGRSRIYMIVSNQFRDDSLQLPSNSLKVLSTPDGACIVAFTEDVIEQEQKRNDAGDIIADDIIADEIIADEIIADSNIEGINNSDAFLDQNGCTSENQMKTFRAHIYFYANFGGPAYKIIPMPKNIQFFEYLQFSCIKKQQMHLNTLDVENGLFNSLITKITLEKAQYKFQQRSNKRSMGKIRIMPSSYQNGKHSFLEGKNTQFNEDILVGENIIIMGEKRRILEIQSNTKLKIAEAFSNLTNSDHWMDFRIEPMNRLNNFVKVYQYTFEKFPIDNCLDPEQNRPLGLSIIIDMPSHDIKSYKEKFRDYVDDMFEELKRSTKKSANNLKNFKTDIIAFSDLNINNPDKLLRFKLGEWIIQLSCLIPIQIAVSRNNLFQPLQGGLAPNDNSLDGIKDGDGLRLNSIAQNISFGWYEGIFKYFGNRQVKVVSIMGERSCGKSYMLNHLVGTMFDVSVMQCTEGVWMSLAITAQYIYVAFDFEGLKSFERTSKDDLFLTLFNAVTSNVVIFKNQPAVDRDMFRIFRDSANLLNDPKLFKAKLCVIIKYASKQDKEDITREFSSKLNSIVAQEGEDNFITRMYPSGIVIIPYQIFYEKSWFTSLEDLKRILDKQEAKYTNARTFLQNTKMIMAKIKTCDWSSLDDNLVQIRISILAGLFQTAISLGVEKKSPAIMSLMDHDTETKIDDPVVMLAEIFENFDNSKELLLDEYILLFEEDTDFVHLSADLRMYFEGNIQQRRECSDDTKWFKRLDQFFKYIVHRRTSRVKEWFKQNTCMFPQDHSDTQIIRYTMEQEISKVNILWTLCGMNCSQCGLRCIKNRDHKNDHDCLTDHKCHFLCQFLEAHPNKNLIPLCKREAGHDGKHACNNCKGEK